MLNRDNLVCAILPDLARPQMGGLLFAPIVVLLGSFVVLALLPKSFADKRQPGLEAVGFRAKTGKLAFLIALWHSSRTRPDVVDLLSVASGAAV